MLLKDPENKENHIVRRLAATEGYEMVSTDANDEPFVLEKDQCWVLADDEKLKPKVYSIHFLVFYYCERKNVSIISMDSMDLNIPSPLSLSLFFFLSLEKLDIGARITGGFPIEN